MEVQEEEEAGLPPRRWLALAVSRNSVVYFNFSLSLSPLVPPTRSLSGPVGLSLARACSGGRAAGGCAGLADRPKDPGVQKSVSRKGAWPCTLHYLHHKHHTDTHTNAVSLVAISGLASSRTSNTRERPAFPCESHTHTRRSIRTANGCLLARAGTAFTT